VSGCFDPRGTSLTRAASARARRRMSASTSAPSFPRALIRLPRPPYRRARPVPRQSHVPRHSADDPATPGRLLRTRNGPTDHRGAADPRAPGATRDPQRRGDRRERRAPSRAGRRVGLSQETNAAGSKTHARHRVASVHWAWPTVVAYGQRFNTRGAFLPSAADREHWRALGAEAERKRVTSEGS